MLQNEQVVQIEEEGVSKEIKEKRLKELREYIQSHNHLYGDHGSMVFGAQAKPGHFDESD